MYPTPDATPDPRGAQNPQLAEFLLKLDSLRKIMKGRTTLVTDYTVAPFDILLKGAEVLKSNKGK